LIDSLMQNQLTITKLDSWNQFFELTQTDILFSEETNTFKIFDIRDLVLSKDILSQLSGSENIYIYSSFSKLLAADKKLILKHDGNVVEVESISNSEVKEFALDYAAVRGYLLPDIDNALLVQITVNFLEIIDILDFIFLSNDPHAALISLIIKEETQIFMLPLRPDKLSDDLKKWIPYLKIDDIQLILSMLFTKLDKHKTQISNSLLKKLIKLDNMIKSQSRLESILLVRLFIWEAINKSK
jgi:hypothetical protein